MAGPTLLDYCLALALGTIWAVGLAPRSAGLALLVVLLARWLPLGTQKENGTPRSKKQTRDSPTTSEGHLDFGKASSLRLHGSFVPSTGLLDFSKDEVHVTENDNCHCTCYILYRPTDDADRDEADAYPNAAHFRGRKRLWEMRWQIRVKRPPKRALVFGLELSEYVPVSGWARRIQSMTVSTLRGVVGKDLYHSCGDSPGQVEGEAERPVFVMPMWAFDQLIVSQAGEEPDIRDIESLGVLRTSGRADFIKRLSSLEMEPGKVYTLAFWCISRFVDVVNWQMMGVVPGGVSFNTFCGKPPVHIVIYEVDDTRDSKDTRHLPSRKTYWFDLALWSSKEPPSASSLRALLPEAEHERQVSCPEENQQGWCCWR